MKTKGILVLFVVLSLILPPARPTTAASTSITSISPSAGWAGTTASNGTLVKIKGTGFEAEPSKNDVRFSDSSGSQTVSAKVEWSAADGEIYKYKSAYGSPGTALGQLNHPWEITIDKDSGDIYVVNMYNKRVEVFSKSGTPLRMIGVGTLDLPWSVALDKNKNIYVSDRNSSLGKGIVAFNSSGMAPKIIGKGDLQDPRDLAIDSSGAIYIIDQGVGKARLVKFDASGSKLSETLGPSSKPFYFLEGLALDPNGTALYLADRSNNVVYKYSQSLQYQVLWHPDSDWGYPSYLNPDGGISVDWQGYLYVPFGNDVVAKVSNAGKLVADITLATEAVGTRVAAIDSFRQLYASDYGICQCVRIFSPTDSGELWVRVPQGAKTGVIKVTTSAGSALSEKFTIFTASGTPTVAELEVTQGLASYPFVSGKETLVWAKLNGLFGDPAQDVATVWVTAPGKTIGLAYNFTHVKYDYSANTTELHYHLPYSLNQWTGEYTFEVLLKRGSTQITDQTLKKTFYATRSRAIAFFRFSDVPQANWNTQDPSPWFDMQAFLHGLATFGRVYPLEPGEIAPYFGDTIYTNILKDGIDNTEKSEITRLVSVARNSWYESETTIHLYHGLLNPAWRNLNANGWAPYTSNVSSAFIGSPSGSTYMWGKVFAHEVGHDYGLVPEDKPNFDSTSKLPNGDPQHHSKNQVLDQEEGAPVMAWNAILDSFLPGSQVGSIMGYNGAGEDNALFESRFQNTNVDYYVLFNKLKGESSASSLAVEKITAELASFQKLVVVGAVSLEGDVTIDSTGLTTSEIPLTPVETGDYSLVFLDGTGLVLAQDSFSPDFAVPDGGMMDEAVLDLIRPYPGATAKVEIRYKDEILATLVPSANPPTVSNVVVSVPGTGLPAISWTGSDPDGDPLIYSVYYSTDGGATFRPIASGLTATQMYWDDRLVGGSTNAVVRVVASDGFYQGSGISSSFTLAEKSPQVVILAPVDGAEVPEGSPLILRGIAFDPEDGLLDPTSLAWELDGETDLGSGEAVTLQDLPVTVPTGTFDMPLSIGTHSIKLLALDSQGTKVTAEIKFTVVADSDRDGIPDEVEESGGGDPVDPFTRPERSPVADPDGPYSAGEGGAINFDGTGSSDPDGDVLTYDWDFGDGATGIGPLPIHAYADEGAYTASLTVTDPSGRQHTASTSVSVTNMPPEVFAGRDRQVNEGTSFALEGASFIDLGTADTHSASIDWGDGSPVETAAISESSGAGTISGSHVFGDDGVFTVSIVVCDDDGGCGQDTFDVSVVNVNPSLTLDTAGATAFPGGSAFLGRKDVEQTHSASAVDPGSDDLTFTWSTGSMTTYFNNGAMPDPYPSPAGIFPFNATNTVTAMFTAPGVYGLGVDVIDDDGGKASTNLPKLVTDSYGCTRSQGFWKHEFSEPGAGQIETGVLQAYLDIVSFASGVFGEQVPAATFQQAHDVLWAAQPDRRGLALQQLLAAWLNFAHGAVGWNELIDTDGNKTGDMPFNQLVATVESILLDLNATQQQLEYAKNLAEAVNLRDAKSRICRAEASALMLSCD